MEWLTQLGRIARRLCRAPLFTVVTLVILAVGIGATTAIFSVVNSILLQPLPYSHPEELVDIGVTAPGIGVPVITISPGAYFTFPEEKHAFQDIGLYDPGINAEGQSVSITGCHWTHLQPSGLCDLHFGIDRNAKGRPGGA